MQIMIALILYLAKVVLTTHIIYENSQTNGTAASLSSFPPISSIHDDNSNDANEYNDFFKITKEITIDGYDITVLDVKTCYDNRFYIESLTITNTSIEEIPTNFFFQMFRLKKVTMSGNFLLKSLPACFYTLRYLKELKIENNLLLTIPRNFYTLERLDLSNNKQLSFFTDLTIFDFLNRLTYLNLSNNKIAILPNIFFKLHLLRELDLSRNSLHSLPQSCSNLISLKTLKLSKNKFTELTNLMYELLLCLETLDLSENLLKAFENRNNTSLEHLLFLNNDSFPLKNLNLSKNRFHRTDFGFDNLEHFKNLEQLTLSNNDLNFIPQAVLCLKNLKFLNISCNCIKGIADSLKTITSLEHLDISNNKMTEFPIAIEESTNLRHLNISYNQISELPIFMLNDLLSLDVSHNKLTSLNYLENFNSLETLNAKDNMIIELFFNVCYLKQLKYLDVSYNYIYEFPLFLNNMKSLKVLNAYKNRKKIAPELFTNITVIDYYPNLQQLQKN